jgi:excisionase family DNA binding protein
MVIRTFKLTSTQSETQLPEWVRNCHLHSSSARPDNSVEPRPHMLTLTEAAAQLRISPRTLRRMVNSGKLAAIRIGRQLRFDSDIFWLEINNLDNRRD